MCELCAEGERDERVTKREWKEIGLIILVFSLEREREREKERERKMRVNNFRV